MGGNVVSPTRRRAGLKIPCPSGRVGSIPTSGIGASPVAMRDHHRCARATHEVQPLLGNAMGNTPPVRESVRPSRRLRSRPVAAPPASIEWDRLSQRSLEIAAHVAVRLAAGFNYVEVAAQIERQRDELRYLDPPEGRPVGKHWCMARMGELRAERRDAA